MKTIFQEGQQSWKIAHIVILINTKSFDLLTIQVYIRQEDKTKSLKCLGKNYKGFRFQSPDF